MPEDNYNQEPEEQESGFRKFLNSIMQKITPKKDVKLLNSADGQRKPEKMSMSAFSRTNLNTVREGINKVVGQAISSISKINPFASKEDNINHPTVNIVESQKGEDLISKVTDEKVKPEEIGKDGFIEGNNVLINPKAVAKQKPTIPMGETHATTDNGEIEKPDEEDTTIEAEEKEDDVWKIVEIDDQGVETSQQVVNNQQKEDSTPNEIVSGIDEKSGKPNSTRDER